MPGIHRHPRRLFPHSHLSASSAFSELCRGRQSFPVCCTAFGLCSAPKLFTKVLVPLLALIRTQGIQVTGYLDDDHLQKDSSPFHRTIHRTIQMLQAFNWVISFQKSALQLSLHLKYLCLDLDTSQAKVLLPKKKMLSLRAHAL